MEENIEEVKLFIETNEFIIFKTHSGRYYAYECDGLTNKSLVEVEVVRIEADASADIDELLDTDFDFDYSGEELDGTNYYYFKVIKE